MVVPALSSFTSPSILRRTYSEETRLPFLLRYSGRTNAQLKLCPDWDILGR